MNKTVTAVIVAAGSSRRMGFDKLACRLSGGTVLELSLRAFDRHPLVQDIVLVTGENDGPAQKAAAGCEKPVTLVRGGETRAISVRNGVNAATGRAGGHPRCSPPLCERGRDHPGAACGRCHRCSSPGSTGEGDDQAGGGRPVKSTSPRESPVRGANAPVL